MKSRKIFTILLSFLTIVSLFGCDTKTNDNNDDEGNDNGLNVDPTTLSDYIINPTDIPLKLQYDEPAPILETENYHIGKTDSDAGSTADDSWEEWSLPIGNAYFGANVFGRTETERIQISEKTLTNPNEYVDGNSIGGLNSFSETYIDFGHDFSDVTNYNRYLDLETAISGVNYTYSEVNYSREYFVSYPDKVLVIRLDSNTDGALSFTLRPTIPYEQDYMIRPGDNISKHGTVTSKVEDGVGYIELSGKMGYYDIDFLGIYKVYTNGGTVNASTTEHTYTDTAGVSHTDTDGTIVVEDATSAYIVVTLGTDYELSSDVFTSEKELNDCLRKEGMETYSDLKPTHYTTLEDTRRKVEDDMDMIDNILSNNTFEEGYLELKERHIEDHSNLFGRNTVDLNCNPNDFDTMTDDLLTSYQQGNHSNYLELLLYQYGRYMLIASSRPGTLPAHLQGVWNTYNSAPWSCNYTQNINVQMNYWPAFSTNLAETFDAYIEYNQAYMEAAKKWADLAVVWNGFSNKYDTDGGNGWVIGHAANPYRVTYDASPGNLGFMTQVFWEYYAYTQDKEALKEIVYPVLYSAAQFITKMVEQDENGNYLVARCDSPEQFVNGEWYYTSGTTYAQSFSYLNNYNLLLAAKELGIDLNNETVLSKQENAVLKTVLEQIDKYDPIIVGLSGQVKEFREEKYYGDLGEWQHRHVAQLVGIFPGNIINSKTPAWIDATKVSLTERGFGGGVGWGVANKMCMWARTKDGDTTHILVEKLLKECIASNLWDLHFGASKNTFQIDGNFGITAGMAELLLQSDAGYIEPLAALPNVWHTGSYTGLVARGNFEVSAKWENGLAKSFNVLSKSGGKLSISYPSITGAKVYTLDGEAVKYTVEGDNLISFDTKVGETYVIYGFVGKEKLAAPTNFMYTRDGLNDFNFTWDKVENADKYNIYLAIESQPDYTLVGTTNNTQFSFNPAEEYRNSRMTFVVTAIGENKAESNRTLCYYNPVGIFDGITIDGIKEDLYGSNCDTVLLDDNRSYTISAVKTDGGVFIYAEGIFNTNSNNPLNPAWYTKTNFEFKLNGGKQSYVNALNQNAGVTDFEYKVQLLPSGKYQHAVEVFVAKELISNWSETEDVQINYAWKTPGENAYLMSDMLDYQHIDWNTDWHSFHRLGGLETYFVPLQANLFISKTGLAYSNETSVDGVISKDEYSGTSYNASNHNTNVEVNGKVVDGDTYLAFTITHNNWSSYDNSAGNWWKNDNIELYVNEQKIVIMFIDGEAVIPSYCTYAKAITNTNSDGKLVTVLELHIKGDSSSYNLKIGVNGTSFGWIGVIWDSLHGTVTENGITVK